MAPARRGSSSELIHRDDLGEMTTRSMIPISSRHRETVPRTDPRRGCGRSPEPIPVAARRGLVTGRSSRLSAGGRLPPGTGRFSRGPFRHIGLMASRQIW